MTIEWCSTSDCQKQPTKQIMSVHTGCASETKMDPFAGRAWGSPYELEHWSAPHAKPIKLTVASANCSNWETTSSNISNISCLVAPCNPAAHPSSRTHCISNVNGPSETSIDPNSKSSKLVSWSLSQEFSSKKVLKCCRSAFRQSSPALLFAVVRLYLSFVPTIRLLLELGSFMVIWILINTGQDESMNHDESTM